MTRTKLKDRILPDYTNHSLEFRRISFVWYSFWHTKTPHFLNSIPYCLTNGVQFKGITAGVLFFVINSREHPVCRGRCLYRPAGPLGGQNHGREPAKAGSLVRFKAPLGL